MSALLYQMIMMKSLTTGLLQVHCAQPLSGGWQGYLSALGSTLDAPHTNDEREVHGRLWLAGGLSSSRLQSSEPGT